MQTKHTSWGQPCDWCSRLPQRKQAHRFAPREGVSCCVFVSGCASHFDRSLAGDQLSPVRTSQQCWCSDNACERNPLTQIVAERIANVTSVPTRYMEPFQVLKYETVQFYKQHHDQNSGLFTPQGVRVFTFFMYLSTP